MDATKHLYLVNDDCYPRNYDATSTYLIFQDVGTLPKYGQGLEGTYTNRSTGETIEVTFIDVEG